MSININKTEKYNIQNKSYLTELYTKYKNINFNSFTQQALIQQIIDLPKNKHVRYRTNLLIINFKYNIKKNNITFNMINKNDIPQDSRIAIINEFFTMFCKWCINKKNNLNLHNILNSNSNSNSDSNSNSNSNPNNDTTNNIIETCILIYLSDRIIWHIKDVDKTIPLCVYAQPNNFNYILIPDNTFHINSDDKRYGKHGLNWESQKKLFTNTNAELELKELTLDNNLDNNLDIDLDIDLDSNTNIIKQNAIFFKGVDTTDKNHNLRYYIKHRLKTDTDNEFKNAMIYEWLTPSNYESVKCFTKYKFLLNLPGRYPWSTRLKYLYLSKSFIINVRVKTLGDGDEDFFKSFVDLIVPDKLCINIDMNYYYDATCNENNKTKEEINKTIEYNEKNKIEIRQVYDKIKEIFHTYKNLSPYDDKNVIKAYNLINNFKTNDMYEYYYNIMLMNYKIGLKPFIYTKPYTT